MTEDVKAELIGALHKVQSKETVSLAATATSAAAAASAAAAPQQLIYGALTPTTVQARTPSHPMPVQEAPVLSEGTFGFTVMAAKEPLATVSMSAFG